MTTLVRPALALLGAAMLCAAPARAQLFWQPPDLSGPPLTGIEPNSGVNLPGATPAELRAGLVWNLRAALNVAALQCDFEPTLLTTSNYNSLLAHHRSELNASFTTIGDYFRRTAGAKAGQKLLDQYGTRTYSAYSTVQAQKSFCQTAGSVGRDALFAPRGGLYLLAEKRLGEIRRALSPHPDLAFGNPAYGFTATLPPMDKKCWRKGVYDQRKCGDRWQTAKR